jgi:hypothetical protein
MNLDGFDGLTQPLARLLPFLMLDRRTTEQETNLVERGERST